MRHRQSLVISGLGREYPLLIGHRVRVILCAVESHVFYSYVEGAELLNFCFKASSGPDGIREDVFISEVVAWDHSAEGLLQRHFSLWVLVSRDALLAKGLQIENVRLSSRVRADLRLLPHVLAVLGLLHGESIFHSPVLLLGLPEYGMLELPQVPGIKG